MKLAALIRPRRGLTTPVVQFRRARRFGQTLWGWANPTTRRVCVYWHPWWSRAAVAETLLHELLHLTGHPGCAGHGPLFVAALVRSAPLLGVRLPAEARQWTVHEVDWGIRWRLWLSDPRWALPCGSAPQGLPELARGLLDTEGPVDTEG